MKKKFLIIFVLVSLTVHALVIAFSFFMDKPAVPHSDKTLKIDSLWTYPPQALSENREGSAMIRFTIAANGSLADSSVLSSSGSALLDDGVLACVRAASLFEPLPGSFNISLLNVTATFSYRTNL
jgi:TonB family protein